MFPLCFSLLLAVGNLLSIFGLDPADSKLRAGEVAPALQMTLRDDSSVALSEYQGKWVVVLIGATWSPSSEATAYVFSNLREKLEEVPFEFIQIFEDPTVIDAELFGFTQFAGIFAKFDPAFQNLPYSEMSNSEWFLVDPQGTVRASGDKMDGDRIRMILSEAWKRDANLSGIDLTPTEVRNLGEQMLLYPGNPQSFVEQARRILDLDPDNQMALRFLLHKSLFVDGYDKSVRDFETRIKGRTITEPTELYLDINRLIQKDSWQNRQKMRQWQAKYPSSEFLECIGLLYN